MFRALRGLTMAQKRTLLAAKVVLTLGLCLLTEVVSFVAIFLAKNIFDFYKKRLKGVVVVSNTPLYWEASFEALQSIYKNTMISK